MAGEQSRGMHSEGPVSVKGCIALYYINTLETSYHAMLYLETLGFAEQVAFFGRSFSGPRFWRREGLRFATRAFRKCIVCTPGSSELRGRWSRFPTIDRWSSIF